MSPNNKINSETSQGRLHVYINLNKLCNLILFLFNCADFYKMRKDIQGFTGIINEKLKDIFYL